MFTSNEDDVDLDEFDDEEPEAPRGHDPKLTDAIAKKQYWRDKAAKEKAEKEELQKKLDEAGTNSGKALDIATDLQLKQNFGLDDQDLTVAKGLASTSGKTVAEILADKESDAFKAFDTFKRGKAAGQQEEAIIPEPTDRVPVVGDKSFTELEEPEKKKNYAGSIDTLVQKARSSNRSNIS